MNEIPLVDLKAQYKSIKKDIDEAIHGVVESTRFIGGPQIAQFEQEFAAYCEAAHCVGVSSGTSALILALKALGISEGDEVITTTHTFVATAEAIAQVGALPVLVDISPETHTLDPELVRAAINGRTRAILPVHIYGYPADMDPLLDLAARYGLFVIEDAAQAHGARYKGHRIGSIGNVACFSFYPGKNLGAYGDAGAVVSDDESVMEKVQMLADHGRIRGSKYEHGEIGSNERMDALQAAILRIKLRHLNGWNEKRRQLAHRYVEVLSNSNSPVSMPQAADWAEPVYHLFVIGLPQEIRPAVQKKLEDAGIATGIHYPLPVHLQPAFAYLGYDKGAFPVSENVASTTLSLPMYPELCPAQVDFICGRLLEAIEAGV